jgi:hypothetical protein
MRMYPKAAWFDLFFALILRTDTARALVDIQQGLLTQHRDRRSSLEHLRNPWMHCKHHILEDERGNSNRPHWLPVRQINFHVNMQVVVSSYIVGLIRQDVGMPTGNLGSLVPCSGATAFHVIP